MTRIRIQVTSGWREVEAEVIRQVGVYWHDGAWNVGHLKSGGWMAGFTHRHVAVNYAKRMVSLFDIDYFWEVEDWDYRNMVADTAQNYRKHPAYVRNCLENSVGFAK